MKKVYLTIDDSPSGDMELKVDYLRSCEIPAVFFCRGDFMEKRPEAVLHAIRNDFIIGNHAYSHRHFSELSPEECYSEIKMTDDLIDRLYQQQGIERSHRLFRFPYGDKGDLNKGMLRGVNRKGRRKKETVQHILREMGYTQPKWEDIDYVYFKKYGLDRDADCSWTFDIMEWSTQLQKPVFGIKNLQQVLQRIDDKKPADCRLRLREQRWLGNPASPEIILLHDQAVTSPFFVPIIDRLLNKQLLFQRIPVQ